MKTFIRSMIANLGVFGELLRFLWQRRLWWLIPMVVMLLLLALLIVFAVPASAQTTSPLQQAVTQQIAGQALQSVRNQLAGAAGARPPYFSLKTGLLLKKGLPTDPLELLYNTMKG